TETRFLQLAPLSFDASTLEIWGPLLNGGAVVVHPEDVPDLTELGRTIADHKVTTAWLTAALFNQVIDRAPQILHSLSELLTGGEALSVPHVVRALAALPGTKLINGYGPTETTTFATTYAIPRDFKSTNRRVPIGRSLPDTQVYVLDQRQQLLPVGVPGEICIGGSGLALGYLGDSGLTAKKFITDFISGNPGERLYRSGDRGRLLPDGSLEFIERTDDQVKIRGFRIEPGEIESMLKLHQAAREVVVVVREDVPGDRRLVAYVAPASAAAQADELREFLKERLPNQMLPSSFVFVDAFPLTPNGKLDRKALPVPEGRPPQIKSSYVAPRTPTEVTLASIFREVLKLDRVGVHDNFFDLGGYSLLAVQLRFQIKRALDIDVLLATIYKWPTVEGIALSVLQRELEVLGIQETDKLLTAMEDLSDD
ncbi:MAG: non-ribosomal peptide synthetase, partial [Xanthobacteraceae bacterium]